MRSNKIVITVFFLLVETMATAQTRQINSFDELMSSLNCGEKVRVIIHYKMCKLFVDQKERQDVPDAVSGMDIGTFEYFAAGSANNSKPFIVFSDYKLIKNPKGKGYVYNYGKVRINSDNTVKVTAQYLKTKNFKVMMDEYFDCEVNNSKNKGGVYLYK